MKAGLDVLLLKEGKSSKRRRVRKKEQEGV